ncbi:hypothetical protein [Desulfoferula mesophila]|uniref:hypothetical protein n=1 Tax=Desulfoferula mesophila TaxID=3058419 RepID=UPI0030D1B899
MRAMRLGPWLIYLALLLLVLTVSALGVGGYFLYQQDQALNEIVKDNRRLRLAAQNLETIVRSLQDRAFVSGIMPPEISPPPRPAPPPPRPLPAPPPEKAAPTKASQDAEDDKAKDNGASTPQEAEAVEPWPTSSDWVDVSKVSLKRSGRDLLVYFEIDNKLGGKQTANGYATVLLRSDRKGDPWVESWPPARLTPLGRPENPKKGAHFSVQKEKRFRARFVLVDKKVEAVEFLIFNEQGELALLVRETPESLKQKK